MANVTQCDVCGNIVKHEENKYIKIYDVDKYRNTLPGSINKDICLNCYEKIKEFLKIK
jgi:hypothetical protein